jgi:hypothetical protein
MLPNNALQATREGARARAQTFGFRRMKYHDFHLRGYSVEQFGGRIVLDLVLNHPGREREESRIVFTGVACHSFDHSAHAIITDIEEVAVDDLVQEEEQRLSFLAHQHGLKHWKSDISVYIATLKKEQLRGWRIGSAIGFGGFVIARAIEGEP